MKKIKNLSFFVFLLLGISSSLLAQTSLTPNNSDIIKSMYGSVAKGDFPAFLNAMDPKIEWNEAENFPYADGNPYIGSKAILEGVFMRLGAEWEYWNLTEQKYYEVKSGEIIVTGRYKAKNKLTSKEINVQFVHLWTLNDGLVTKFQQYADTYQTVQAMK